MNGLFITFEGPEGSGKSTQVRLLAKYLKDKNINVETSREPGGTEFADSLRNILLDKNTGAISPRAELLLLETARADHVEKVIRPAIEAGKVMICDRFTDSSIAYQGGGRGIKTETIINLNDFATGGIAPHLTFILDIPPEVGLERARRYGAKEHDRLESEKLHFHLQVRETFLALAEKSPDKYLVLNGMESVELIAQKIQNKVEDILNALS